MSDQPRPVLPIFDDERARPLWLRELVANAIYNHLVCGGYTDLADQLRAAWDAAPADATEAVRRDLAQWRALPINMRDVDEEDVVLRALGMPDA